MILVYMRTMMSEMMPYMEPMLHTAVGLVLIGLLVMLIYRKSLFGANKGSDLDTAEQRGAVGIIGKITAWFGLFFIACNFAAPLLGMSGVSFTLFKTPGDVWSGTDVAFWLVGLILLIIGLVYWLLSRRSVTTEA